VARDSERRREVIVYRPAGKIRNGDAHHHPSFPRGVNRNDEIAVRITQVGLIETDARDADIAAEEIDI
jgi:hypothetical protein